MIGEKIVITSVGGAASHREWAPGVGTTHARTIGASVDRPLRGADRAPHGAGAALPLRGTDLRATWRKGWTQPRLNPSWVWTRPRPNPSWAWTRPPQVGSGHVHVELGVGAGRVHDHPYVGSKHVRAQPDVLI
jgi:hypothetical protein